MEYVPRNTAQQHPPPEPGAASTEHYQVTGVSLSGGGDLTCHGTEADFGGEMWECIAR